MKGKSKWIVVFLTLSLVMACFTACSSDDTAKDEPADSAVPTEVQAVKDKVIGIAEKYAKQLDGEWGDQHAALIRSGEGEKFKDFAAMKAKLDGFREESGATYVYALYSEEPDSQEPFIITVDGSKDPDDYGKRYEWEIQFKEAWDGTPAAARSAWADNEEGTELCWSAFAPIHDSEGNVVAILGVDYPAPEILDFPEWNRDSDQWNKIEE